MSDESDSMLLAAGAGVVTGMRSFTMPAVMSRQFSKGDGGGHSGRLAAAFSNRTVANILTALATGELVADKSGKVPNRTDAPSFLGRTILGGVCGAAIAGAKGRDVLAHSISGAVAAGLSTVFFFFARKILTKAAGLPDPLVAIAEDALAIRIAVGVGDRLISGY